MKKTSKSTGLLATIFSIVALVPLYGATSQNVAQRENQKPIDDLYREVAVTSPEASMAKMEVPDGYKLELVASEPMIQEPVLCVWDGNGRMYVAQMNTYMQDADGTDENEPRSQVLLLEDLDGDGKMDKSTVFVDNLILPRMILPLDERIIIGTTHTEKLFAYTDTDGDGVADKKELWLDGGVQKGNMEHQPSGLVWNIDNWIYQTYSKKRIRFTSGKIEFETIPKIRSQWGLSQDDRGRMYSGSAGGEQSFNSFQQPWRYGSYDPPKQLEDDFQTVWPIAKIPDTQGGGRRLREDNTLNHFTAGCGHSIYRGTATPAFKGSLFICEPVGRLVRRAVSENINGKRVLSNPHGQGEFIRSVDPNFRPVNSATGPDGCLYIVDMYRGIIQQGNWTRKGSYLRGVIDQYGLSKNTSRGRIYRLVPEEGYGKTKQPNMLNESSDELVSHLSHPNAWWRDTARKLMILRADMSVAAKLEQIVESSSSPSYAKVNAIWTLEGLEKLSSPLLVKAAKSKHKDVQIAALQASESLLKEKNQGIIAIHQNLAKHSESEEVRIQAYLSAKNYAPKELRDEMMQYAISGAKADSPRQWFHNIYVRDKKAAEMKAMQIAVAKQKNAKLAEVVESGRKHYSSMCISCHGENGQGVPMAGTNTRLGAPLAGSTRVKGSPEALMRILLNGLVGPIDGKTYPGMMSSMSSLDDKWLADVATYIRNDWGNQSRLITPEMVARIRKETSHRSEPWTIDKLKPWSKDILAERHTWKLNASHNTKELKKAIDGEPKSRWSSLKTQRKSMWISLELPDVTTVGGIILDTTKSPKDFSDELKIEASLNGNIWSTVIADLRVNKPNGSIHFPQSVRAKFIRVTVLKKKSKYWSIHELNLI